MNGFPFVVGKVYRSVLIIKSMTVISKFLQALSMLLNAQSFPFVIDLACLASRREYLKLEKWLTDKIREHGEPFISACVKFLQVTLKGCRTE